MADKKAKGASTHPKWHPDFRDTEVLPDIKVVRTNFLVNFIAFALAVVAVGNLAFSEYQALTMSKSIEAERAKIDDGLSANRNYLKASKEFEAEAPKIRDLNSFYTGYVDPLEVVLALSESRPETVALGSIRVGVGKVNKGTAKRPKMVLVPECTINGRLRGDSAEALDVIDEYATILRNMPIFQDRLDSIEVSRPTRNATLGVFEFSVVIKLKALS